MWSVSLVLVSLSLLLPSPAVQAGVAPATIYVDGEQGNDASGTGSKANPYKSPGKGCSVVQPGGTVMLRGKPSPGTMVYLMGGNFKCNKGTSWQAPVTLTHEPGENVTFKTNMAALAAQGIKNPNAYRALDLRQQDEDHYLIVRGEDDPARLLPKIPPGFANKYGKRFVWDQYAIKKGDASGPNSNMPASHVKIEGIEVKNGKDVNAIAVGNHWELRRNYFHDNGRTYPDGSPKTTDHNIYTHCSDCVFEDNIFDKTTGWTLQLTNNKQAVSPQKCVRGIRDVPGYPPGQTMEGCGLINVTVHHNLLRHGGQGGLVVNTGKDIVVTNNMFDSNPTSIGANAPATKFYNNTLYGGRVQVEPGCDQCEFKNTIIWRPGAKVSDSTFFFFRSTSTRPAAEGVVLSHNLTSAAAAPTPPIVVNAKAGDFRLASNSPAINAGAPMPTVKDDFFHATRPVGGSWDIGAHEFGATGTPPAGDKLPPSMPTQLKPSLITPP